MAGFLKCELKETCEDKKPRILGTADKIIHIREDRPTVQLRGGREVAVKWINGQYPLGHKHRGKIGHTEKKFYSWWRRKIALPISKVDDYVMHIFREYIKEADHWANLGAEGQRKSLLTMGIVPKDGRRCEASDRQLQDQL